MEYVANFNNTTSSDSLSRAGTKFFSDIMEGMESVTKARLIVSIIGGVFWEVVMVAVWWWGLPAMGINLHVGVLIIVMALFAIYSVVTYEIGARVLRRKAVAGMSEMVGCRGRAIKALAPVGTVQIGSEFWTAKSADSHIKRGEAVEVVGQEGLKLVVRKEKPAKH